MALSTVSNSTLLPAGNGSRARDTSAVVGEAIGQPGPLIEEVEAQPESFASAGTFVGREAPAPEISLQPIERISPSPSSFRAAIALYTQAQNLPAENTALDADPAQSLVGVDLFV